MNLDSLISSNKLISDQIDQKSLRVVLENLSKTINSNVIGDIVEFGCYIGTTSLFIRRTLDAHEVNKEFHVYDSFEGLPDRTFLDGSTIGLQFKKGELKVTKMQFLNQFKKNNLRAPIVHKGWFNEFKESDVPDKISFAFLDGDFYESILASIRLVWPKLSNGGIVCVDDFRSNTLPGVEKALLNYFGGSIQIVKKENIGVLIKR